MLIGRFACSGRRMMICGDFGVGIRGYTWFRK